MIRLTLALAVWIGFVSAGSATLAPRKESVKWDKEGPPAAKVAAKETVVEDPGCSEFAVSEQTEILLDGKPCSYAQIPANAAILRMEVAPDRKSAVRIHFRTRK